MEYDKIIKTEKQTQESNGNFNEVEWKFPFNLGFGLGDLFHGLVFGGAKKHRTAKSSSTPSTPRKVTLESKRASMIEIPVTAEHIEMASLVAMTQVPEGHTGAGHNFKPREMDHPTWCDRCGDLVWGLNTAHYLRCQNCNLTCHKGCQDAVTLDCESLDLRSPSDADVPHPDLTQDYQIDFEEVTLALHNTYPKDNTINTDVDTTYGSEDSGLFLEETLHAQIKAYNFHATPGFQMAFVPESEGSLFRGFIRVHMNLTRPINVVAGTRPPSIYDILKEDDTLEKKTLTTFYLPRDTVRALHITSETTTQEVIRVLLKKFKVVDNPRKFALYERYYDHGETTKVKMRRIADNEKPLVLALLWGCEKNCNKRFVLQENDTGDILWEAFSLPELSNFLRILDREEEEYKRQVQQKYKLMEMRIRDAMERIRPPTIEIISPIITCNVLKIELEPSSNLTESET